MSSSVVQFGLISSLIAIKRPPRKFAFTDTRLKELSTPLHGAPHVYVYDTTVPGLCVRLTSGGKKVFVAACRVHGRPRRITLGHIDRLRLSDARTAALQIVASIASGGDPVAERTSARVRGVTLEQVWDDWRARNWDRLRPPTQAAFEILWRRELLGLQSTPVVDITRAQVQRRIDTVAAKRPPTARKLKAFLALLLEFAVRNDIVATNAARSAQAPAYVPRSRIVSSDELPHLLDAIEAAGEPWRDIVRLILMTGSRRSALMAMQWDHVDLTHGVWTIPSQRSKNKHVTPISLTRGAQELLRTRLERRAGEAWVFPSPTGYGPLRRPEKAWKRICKAANIEGLTLHDLRRSFGTTLARGGASASIIASALGHRSASSARTYIHLAAADVQSAVEKAAEAMTTKPLTSPGN